MLFLAWRQLMARKKQSILILFGISFGTLLFVTISGLQLGMRAYISEQLLNNTAHVLISGAERDIIADEMTNVFYGDNPVRWVVPPAGKRRESRLENYADWYRRLSEDPNVVEFSPRLSTNVLLTSGDFTATVGLTGVLPERHARVSSILKYMKEGNFLTLASGGNNIVIGSEVAHRLGVRLNQFVNVGSGDSASKPFKVIGIVHFGNKQIDDAIAFAHLKNVQVVTRSPGRVSQIAVALADIDRAGDVADTWSATSHDKVEDWQEANKSFMEVIKVQDFTRYFITTAVLIVAAFGIYNVLTIMINQKRKEIAILRALGYGPRRILNLILYQGIMLGLSGGVTGLILGYFLCVWIHSIDFGFEIGGSNHLLIDFSPSTYVVAFFSAAVTSVLASLPPAWGASRMTPIDIIRSD